MHLYCEDPKPVYRSINACAVVCTDTLSTLRPGSARHSGQIGCGGPGRGGTAERPAASRQGGAQLLTCEDASDADCDDGGPSSDYSICPNGPDCHDLAMTAARANRYVS